MSLVKVNEDIDVVNVDDSWLRQIKVNNNTLDNGAMLVMDGLKQFIDNQMAAFKGFEIPYEELFLMLRQIIECACDNDKVRNALMTGVISVKKKFRFVKKSKKKKFTRVVRNENEVREYAKTHSAKDVIKQFNFPTENAFHQYVFKHKIEYKKRKCGRPRKWDEEELKKLSKDLTLTQMAILLNKTPSTMWRVLKLRGIKCKGCRK